MSSIASINTIKLPVMEQFHTIQGEGYHQGNAAYFIRLGGCDVGCVWCDVKESWNADKHPKYAVEDIITMIKSETPGGIVVVTGGEPLMHDLNHLTHTLQNAGYRTHIETSATHALSGNWDWICVSPKKFKSPLPTVMQQADELKIIVYNTSDFKWAEIHAQSVNETCKLYLQPEWSMAEKMTPLIVDYIKSNPQWQLSLQIHKYIQVP